MKIKNHHDRPRPKVMAKKIKTKMEDIEMASMKTPSYPSGHSVQGVLIANALADKYPNKKDKLKNSTTDELLDQLNIIEEDLGQTEFIDKVINRLKDEIKTELSLRT